MGSYIVKTYILTSILPYMAIGNISAYEILRQVVPRKISIKLHRELNKAGPTPSAYSAHVFVGKHVNTHLFGILRSYPGHTRFQITFFIH